MSIIAEKFPELLPVATLFYSNSGKVNLRRDNGSWHTVKMEEGLNRGCPLSSIFAAIVLNKILMPLDRIMKQHAAEQVSTMGPVDDGYGARTHQRRFVDNLSVIPSWKIYCSTFKSLTN